MLIGTIIIDFVIIIMVLLVIPLFLSVVGIPLVWLN
jgi:hypothetical protein